jgi:hypothetical protein
LNQDRNTRFYQAIPGFKPIFNCIIFTLYCIILAHKKYRSSFIVEF